MDKKQIGIALMITAVVILIITLVLSLTYDKNTGEKRQSTDTTRLIGSATADITIEDMDSLYFYTSAEHQQVKHEITQYLQDNGYTDVKLADIVGDVKAENNIFTYWIYVSRYDLVMRCKYDMYLNKNYFAVETDKALLENMLGINTPDGDGDFGPDDVDEGVQITNNEYLEQYLSAEQISILKSELGKYLAENTEYRRSIIIEENIQSTEQLITFTCTFSAQRPVSDYNITVTFYKFGAFDFKKTEVSD